LIDLYRETHTPWDWHERLADKARSEGIGFGSSVFDEKSADHIAALNPSFMKIASFEINDTPLIAYAAGKRFPMVLSCGMASTREARSAAETVMAGTQDFVPTILACPPGYPSPISGGQFDLPLPWAGPWGLSDHSTSKLLPALAVAKGAMMIEKHIKPFHVATSDAAFSFDPQEFSLMVANIRAAETAMAPLQRREEPQRDLRRSIYVVADISEGEKFSRENVRSIRPGHGLAPSAMGRVLRSSAKTDLKRGHPLSMADLA
jgi:pseudaminic acid synthase